MTLLVVLYDCMHVTGRLCEYATVITAMQREYSKPWDSVSCASYCEIRCDDSEH